MIASVDVIVLTAVVEAGLPVVNASYFVVNDSVVVFVSVDDNCCAAVFEAASVVDSNDACLKVVVASLVVVFEPLVVTVLIGVVVCSVLLMHV